MTVDFYTIPQQITLVITSLLSGSVSLLGSLTLIFIIWRDRHKKLKFVYHRILFAMSILDAVISLNFAFSFLAVPIGMFWGAQGNTASCEASGFLQLLYSAQGLYNFGLAVYYLMIIRYGKSEGFVSRFIEPYVHALSLCVPIGFGCWAIFLDVLNPSLLVGGWCTLQKYPPGCDEFGNGGCTRGEMADVIGRAVGIGIVLSSLVGIVTIMIMLICHVRGRHAAVTQYHTRPQLDRTVTQTVRQAMLYIWASLIPCVVILPSGLVSSKEQIPRLILALLTKLILPLQGLFNLIIYVRPRYVALKQRRGDSLSFLTMVKYIIVGEPPPLQPDQRLDDWAPELTVPGSFRQSASSHSHDTLKEEPRPPTQDVQDVSVDSEETVPESNQGY